MNETNKIYPRPENTIQFRFNKINGYCILRIKGLYLCSAVVKKKISIMRTKKDKYKQIVY